MRSIRNSGHSDDYKSLKRLLARRHQWQEPEPESSETVIVRSLPLLPYQVTPQYYTGGREPVARLVREPAISPGRQTSRDREQLEPAVRGTVQESPRSASLISPVQNILPEPVAAVPSLPVTRVLQPVAAVPDLPVTQLPASRRPVISVPTVPSVATSSFRSFSRGGSVTVPSRSPVTVSRGVTAPSRSPVTVSRSPPIRVSSPTQRARQRITEAVSQLSILGTTPASRPSSPAPRSPALPPVFRSVSRPTKAARIPETPRGGSTARGQERGQAASSEVRESVVRSSSSSVSSVSSSVRSHSVSKQAPASISAPVRHPVLG